MSGVDANRPVSGEKTVAVMQPYFFPYLGYFRLFVKADEFILFDSAQFARRGRVHRCQVPGPSGSEVWLTLPLQRQPQKTLIRDLGFADDARRRLDRRLARLPWFQQADGPNATQVRDFLARPLESVVDFLEDGLRLVLGLLDVQTPMQRSSTLTIDPELRGQDRILALCRATGAHRYVNAPGGRDLYDPQVFADHGIQLCCLPPYRGPHLHLLPALMSLPASELKRDLPGRDPLRRLG